MRPPARHAPARVAGLLCCALAPAVVRAQTTPGAPPTAPAAAPAAAAAHGVVIGVIYDSLGARPLRGADVRLDGTRYTATTDAAGAFRMADVPPGEYVIAFDHAEFDSLGVGLPYGRVRVADGDTVAVSLATPSVGAVARRLCPAVGLDTAGVLLGVVRRAGGGADGTPLAGATLTARWTEWVAGARELRRAQRERTATADASGVYRMCGVPNDVAVQLAAAPPATTGVADVRTGSVAVDLHDRTLTLRDVSVRVFPREALTVGADSAAARADAAALALHVVDDVGRPVPNAQLRAAGRDAPLGASDETGTLRAGNLPAGSQSFQLLALGYAPRTVSVDLRAGRTSESTVRIGPRTATQLSEVRVVGRARFGFDRTGFEERRRTGMGHYMTADEIRARQPTYFSQLAYTQLGFEVVPKPYGGGYTIRGRRSGSVSQTCAVQYFVDGTPVSTPQLMDGGGEPTEFSGNPTDIDDIINPNEVRGVEFYAGIGTVPAMFNAGSRNACGTIVIWTGVNRAPSSSSR